MSKTVAVLLISQGDVIINYNDGSKTSVKQLIADVAKTNDCAYGFGLHITESPNVSAHLTLPEEHYKPSDKGTTGHKGYLAAKLLHVTYDALRAAGIPENQLQDHTMSKGRDGNLRPDIGIWINQVQTAGAGIQTGPTMEDRVSALTEQFFAAGGTIDEIPNKPNSVLDAWLRSEISRRKSAEVAKEIRETPSEPEKPESSTTGVSIEEM